MKMLSEDEICKLCKETQQKTVNYLAESERKRTERMAAFRASQEKQYQHDLERYQSQLKYYEHALKTYEANVKREEIEYPKRVETWEKSEEQRKKSIEQFYEQAVKSYERALKEYEANVEREEIEYPKRVAAWEKSEEQRKKAIEQYHEQAVKAYEQALKEYEQEEIDYPERVAAWEESEKQRKKSIEEHYEKAVKEYEQALERYEANVKQEEIEYPKRVKAWEENEEWRKKHIEEYYEQSVEAYEKAKRQYETSGATYLGPTYNVPYPQKQAYVPYPKPIKHKYNKPNEPHKQNFVPHPKPVMHKRNKPTEPKKQTFSPSPKPVKYKYYKPTEPHKQNFTPSGKPIKNKYYKPTKPVPPKKPDEKQSGLNSGFSSLFSMIGLMFTSSFSERAVRQLHKLDLSNPADKNKAYQIIFREMYLNQRTSMECSQSEGRGISPALDGLYGEKLTVFELELCIFAGYKGNILHNLEIEVGNRTIQIDVLFVTQKGIFVIESKNYSGSVSGAEYQNKWTLRTHKKDYHFYNPITQNQTHINTLSRVIRSPRFFSLVAFSERCDLEYIDIHKRDVFVFNRYALHDVIHDIFSNEPDILSVQDVAAITDILHRYCADNSETNPNYKESRSYYSAGSKVNEHPNASYQHRKTFRKRNSYFYFDDEDDYDDYDDYDDD